ncbi:hypothetical protein BB559_004980 [Furculomyces boomerangus]|uniref:Nucleolar complex-associated protein 3 n=1 Tax=Furculomyces boomerangus TaxID=61424 RepID=A0A2T9YBK3_9FUNG|nr:hypothetical protein BB559_004980 [Furculomyces boomerangus]
MVQKKVKKSSRSTHPQKGRSQQKNKASAPKKQFSSIAQNPKKRAKKEISIVEQEDLELEDEDQDFIHKNASSLNFLTRIEPTALIRNDPKKIPLKQKDGQKKKHVVQAPQQLSDTESEGSDTEPKRFSKQPPKKSNGNISESDVENVSDRSDIEELSDSDESALEELSDEEDYNTDDSESAPLNSFEEFKELDDSKLTEGYSDIDSVSQSEDSDMDDEPSSNDEDDIILEESDDDGYKNRKEKKKSKKEKESSELMSYELVERKFKEDSSSKAKNLLRLPIKNRYGRVLAASDHSSDEEDEVEGDSDVSEKASDNDSGLEDSGSESDGNEKETKDVIIVDRSKLTADEYLVSSQIRIAESSEKILESPEENMSHIKTLLAFASPETEPESRVCQLGLLSLLSVFRDIVPGYFIRELTEKEKETKVTKEIKQQRRYEETLVRNYKSYLTLLFSLVKDGLSEANRKDTVNPITVNQGLLATKCLVELVTSIPHFNFRADIIEQLVEVYIQTPEKHEKVSSMATEARLGIIRLLKIDLTGRYSEEACLIASKRIKRLSYKIDPSGLAPWLSLPLCDELTRNPQDVKQENREKMQKERAKQKLKLMKRLRQGRNVGSSDTRRALHMSKKQKKQAAELKLAQQDLKVAEAEVNLEERQVHQTNTLKHVFVTYFRILKHQQSPGLYPAVLEGLARFAHLISVDFFPDVLSSLKSIIRGNYVSSNELENKSNGVNKEQLGSEKPKSKKKNNTKSDENDEIISFSVSTRSVLLSVLTAVHILTAQKETVSLDLVEFFNYLYALIPILATNTEIEEKRGENLEESNTNWEASAKSESELFLDCLNLMFLKKHHKVPVSRVCSFAKRISVAICYFPPKTAVGCLKFISLLMSKYSDLASLFKSSNISAAGGSGGPYLPYVNEADMANGINSCFFEMHQLLLHHNSKVRTQVDLLLKQATKIEKEEDNVN